MLLDALALKTSWLWGLLHH